MSAIVSREAVEPEEKPHLRIFSPAEEAIPSTIELLGPVKRCFRCKGHDLTVSRIAGFGGVKITIYKCACGAEFIR